jgi:DNA-directed RNA polymerase specialized sigma24 family protein
MCEETNKYQQYFDDKVISTGLEEFENLPVYYEPIDDCMREENLAKLKQIYKISRLTKAERELFENVCLLGYKDVSEMVGKSISTLHEKVQKIRQKMLKATEKKGITV